MNKEDQFQVWLMEMDDSIEDFCVLLPENTKELLDFSIESLKIISNWLLDRYDTISDVKKESEKYVIDGAARYIGETFRKNAGGEWFIAYTDKKNIYYGLPQLKDMNNQKIQECPYDLVLAVIDRKDANFLFSLLTRYVNN